MIWKRLRDDRRTLDLKRKLRRVTVVKRAEGVRANRAELSLERCQEMSLRLFGVRPRGKVESS